MIFRVVNLILPGEDHAINPLLKVLNSVRNILEKKCGSCGEQATNECEAGILGLCCGMPLCDNCEHELDEKGTNGHDLNHCRKKDQKYKPWYEQGASV